MSSFFRIFVSVKEDNIDIRRNTEGSLHQKVSNDLIIRRKPLKKQTDFKKRVKSSKAEYTFLQFHYVIWKWASANHKLTHREIGILLYIAPLITFTSREFTQALKELSSSDAGTLVKFRKDGWVNEWSKEGRYATYVLSNKANTLVARLHRMYMSEEEIPMSARRNVILKKKDKENVGLIDIFKQFNNNVKQKQNEKRENIKNRKSSLRNR